MEKRTSESYLYEIICVNLLKPGETLLSVTSVTDDQRTLTYGMPAINAAPITYPLLNLPGLPPPLVAPIGSVIQVRISGGTIPGGADELECTVRPVGLTSLGNTPEATFVLTLRDQIECL